MALLLFRHAYFAGSCSPIVSWQRNEKGLGTIEVGDHLGTLGAVSFFAPLLTFLLACRPLLDGLVRRSAYPAPPASSVHFLSVYFFWYILVAVHTARAQGPGSGLNFWRARAQNPPKIPARSQPLCMPAPSCAVGPPLFALLPGCCCCCVPQRLALQACRRPKMPPAAFTMSPPLSVLPRQVSILSKGPRRLPWGPRHLP